jgi:hypothetical protein
MCCDDHGMHGHHSMHCWRQFLTKEEKIEMLETYQKRLERETQGVKETIENLKKAS